MDDEFIAQVSGIGALMEPSRRALYLYVASQSAPVSREQVADGVDLPLHSTKFHLDRLVEEGLLDVEFRRLTDRTGPGAGRPAKLYRRSCKELALSLPERHYDLAGGVLAEAIDRALRDGVPLSHAIQEAAVAAGRRIAEDAIAFAAKTRASEEGPEAAATGTGACEGGTEMERLAAALAQHGYEPRMSTSEIALANCPFDALARKHTELVCSLNLSLIDGVIDAMGCTHLETTLAPQPGKCCVLTRQRAT